MSNYLSDLQGVRDLIDGADSPIDRRKTLQVRGAKIAATTDRAILDVYGGDAANDVVFSQGSALTDYALPDGAYWLKIQATADFNFNGMSGGSNGRRVIITNIAAIGSGFDIVVNHNTTASAANRFYVSPSSITLTPGLSCEVIYDDATDLGARWRVLRGA